LFFVIHPEAISTTPRARAIAQVREQDQRKIMMMVADALASAIVVFWMAYFPSLISTAPTNLNIE